MASDLIKIRCTSELGGGCFRTLFANKGQKPQDVVKKHQLNGECGMIPHQQTEKPGPKKSITQLF